ncbi:MAG: prolipoprotein diacylglyceryl transferase, partial [Planctomycetota bacterium]
AAAILVGSYLMKRRSKHYGLDPGVAESLLYAIFAGGFIGAHLVDVLVYRPEALSKDPLLLFKIWDGMSSFGGFFGALLGGALYSHLKGINREQRWGYYESTIYGLPFGWTFGRLGCFMAHDHPGKTTDFFLAIEAPAPVYTKPPFHYPEGPFFDLGLLEMLYTMCIATVVFFVARRKPRPIGFYLVLVLVLYAPVRFGLDFLRVVDVRYGGFTPGQYSAFALLVIAALVWWRRPENVYGFQGGSDPIRTAAEFEAFQSERAGDPQDG